LKEALIRDFPHTSRDDRLGLDITRNNLAALLASAGRQTEEEDLRNQSIAYQQQRSEEVPSGVQNPADVARSLNNLGVALYRARRLDEVERAYLRGLAALEALPAKTRVGERYLEVVLNMNLGHFVDERDRYADAEGYFRRGLDILRQWH